MTPPNSCPVTPTSSEPDSNDVIVQGKTCSISFLCFFVDQKKFKTEKFKAASNKVPIVVSPTQCKLTGI